jgi:hypothetical protein
MTSKQIAAQIAKLQEQAKAARASEREAARLAAHAQNIARPLDVGTYVSKTGNPSLHADRIYTDPDTLLKLILSPEAILAGAESFAAQFPDKVDKALLAQAQARYGKAPKQGKLAA